MASPRKERHDQFTQQNGWGHYALSFELLFAADHLLWLAFEERRSQVYRLAQTHYTSFAIGAITLATTAFDAFLNEVHDLRMQRGLVPAATTVEKFGHLLRQAAAIDVADLERLIVVRNEIVHYLPRPLPNEGHVAEVLQDLDRRGLLMSTPTAISWEIPQRLASYALAYWAFETIEMAVARLVAATPEEYRFSVAVAGNFSGYRQRVEPPAQLREFDRRNGLLLTEAARA